MKNDPLSQIWDSQQTDLPLENANDIIKKARKQRKRQFTAIVVMSTTVLLLAIFTIYYATSRNNFALGLLLMISSLTVRIILEFVSLYRKESQLISLDNQSFKKYLKQYHKTRLKINYLITPLCFALYVFGFTMLLPYFKQAFSSSFYAYILLSGIISLSVVAAIIINSTLKERNFLRQLNRK